MTTFCIAILSIALSVMAQFLLKTGMSGAAVKAMMAEPKSCMTLITILTDKYVLGGFLLYGLGAVAWLGVLSQWEVSKAYPLVGLGFVLTLPIAYLLGEQVSLGVQPGSGHAGALREHADRNRLLGGGQVPQGADGTATGLLRAGAGGLGEVAAVVSSHRSPRGVRAR